MHKLDNEGTVLCSDVKLTIAGSYTTQVLQIDYNKSLKKINM